MVRRAERERRRGSERRLGRLLGAQLQQQYEDSDSSRGGLATVKISNFRGMQSQTCDFHYLENLLTSLIHKLQSPQHTRARRARAEALSSFISLLSVRQNIFIALQRFCEIMGLLWQWQVQIHCQKVQLFSIHFHKQELCSFILNFSAKLKLLGITPGPRQV